MAIFPFDCFVWLNFVRLAQQKCSVSLNLHLLTAGFSCEGEGVEESLIIAFTKALSSAISAFKPPTIVSKSVFIGT